MSYDNSNRIALWYNDKRQKQNHPHMKGSGNVSGEYWVSAWFSKDILPDDQKLLMQILQRYTSKKPFISISVQSKAQQQTQPQQTASQPAPQPTGGDILDDDIPFAPVFGKF